VRAIMISPEVSSVRDMLRLAGLLVSHGVSHLSCFFHSPSLCPGLSQFNRTKADVKRMYDDIDAFANGLARITTPRFLTAGAAAALLAAPDAAAALAGGAR
jgi:hypothetical protein